jgi:hypothetical protein
MDSVVFAITGSPLPTLTMKDFENCPDQLSDWERFLSTVLVLGMFASYVPQQWKIIQSKSSEGISPWFLLLGMIGCTSTLMNVILLQDSIFQCCQNWVL